MSRELSRIFQDNDSHYYNPDLLIQTLKVYIRCQVDDGRNLDEVCAEIKSDVEYLNKFSSKYKSELNNYYLKLKNL